MNIFRCDTCRNRNGPKDEGLFKMNDYDVSRRYTPKPNHKRVDQAFGAAAGEEVHFINPFTFKKIRIENAQDR